MTQISSEMLFELCAKKLNSFKKPNLVDIAKEINGTQVLENFEQIGRPINVEDLTMVQLKRYITKKMTDDIAKKILGPSLATLNANSCSICMELMGRQKNSLECGHWVHFECMKKTNGTCPICRRNVISSLPNDVVRYIEWNQNKSKMREVYQLNLFAPM